MKTFLLNSLAFIGRMFYALIWAVAGIIVAVVAGVAWFFSVPDKMSDETMQEWENWIGVILLFAIFVAAFWGLTNLQYALIGY